MRRVLDTQAERLTPAELVSAILAAPVDLIFNGGIGTYFKGSDEVHADVGDKANDAVRIDGAQIRARVVAEGGNLGMTQLARVEFASRGGACNTDFIDNSGGVDCSDHEVNIKILLNAIVAAGDMTGKQRVQLLEEMRDDVAALVLANNYRQAQSISLAEREAALRINEHRGLIASLEASGGARPRARVPAPGRGAAGAPRQGARAHAAGVRAAFLLRQGPAQARHPGLRRAGGSVPLARARERLPGAALRALPRPPAAARAAPRDRGDTARQRCRGPDGHHVHRSHAAVHRRAGGRDRARLGGRARGARSAPLVGRGRGAGQRCRRQRCSWTCSRTCSG